MSKKRKTTDTSASANAVSAPPAPQPEAPQAAATTERAPQSPDTRVFTVTEQAFTPGKGFATELYAAMKTLGSATPQQAADALLASGAYQRVAPKAAALRPVKPVETLLKQWLARGVVKVSEVPATAS